MKKIVTLSGDGIGTEIMAPALEVLQAVAEKYSFDYETTEMPIGGIAIDTTGEPLPTTTLESARNADAVLLGAVGGPKWADSPKRPEEGLLSIREELGLFANLRPAVVYSQLKSASPLKEEILGDNLDILVVRELTGGIYFGKSGRSVSEDDEYAFDTEEYTKSEIQRIAHVAFKAAQGRKKKLTSIDKANVLESSRLWRKTVNEISGDYPDVTVEHMYVDNGSMQLVRNPNQFDVILTNNIFGDILSDEASQITGSIGMLASASTREDGFGMYEPIHGSAPDIAGKNIANPMAMILSVAMMFRYSFNREDIAAEIESAVEKTLEIGIRTADIAQESEKITGTKEVGKIIVSYIKG